MGTGPSFKILHKLHPLKILSFMMNISRPALSSAQCNEDLSAVKAIDYSGGSQSYRKKLGKIGAKDASAQNSR